MRFAPNRGFWRTGSLSRRRMCSLFHLRSMKRRERFF
jgi:hypothetical protein